MALHPVRYLNAWLTSSDRSRPWHNTTWPRLAGLAMVALSLVAPPAEAWAQRERAVTSKAGTSKTGTSKTSTHMAGAGKKTRHHATAHRKQGHKARHRVNPAAARAVHAAHAPRAAYLSHDVEAAVGPLATTGRPAVASRTVLVFDETSGRPLYSRNDDHAQPIASITKLMTAMVVLDAHLPMDERLTITWDDVDHLRGSSSRVPVGAELSREELLRLALMSSENRAAAALGRNYPGGTAAFVRAMNAKAAALGMNQSRFEDSTGLDGGNRASAMDLVRMVQAAREYPHIREFSTTQSHQAELGRRHVEFRNTNALVRSPDWDIGVSKTGYIREAGRCLVMHARIAARPVVIVLLDGDGKYTRIGDASRIKKWLEARWRVAGLDKG